MTGTGGLSPVDHQADLFGADRRLPHGCRRCGSTAAVDDRGLEATDSVETCATQSRAGGRRRAADE